MEVFAEWASEWWSFGVLVVTFLVLLATFIALLLSALFAKGQLLHAQTEREQRFVFDLNARWGAEGMEEARRDVNSYQSGYDLDTAMVRLEANNSYYFYMLLRIPTFFEEIGVVTTRDENLLSLVDEMIGMSVIYYYDLYMPWIVRQRNAHKDSRIYEHFEKLRRRMIHH